MKRVLKLVAAMSAVTVLFACGGGGGGGGQTVPVVASDLKLAVSPATGAAIVKAIDDQVFTFSAVPVFGTSNTTTVAINGDQATPTFNISEAGGGTASGDLGFGSCIFQITQSTFPASHPLALGKTVTVSPCEVNVATRGAPTDAQSSRAANLQLASAASQALQVNVNVTPSGNVTVNGQGNVGSVTVSLVTGS
jgi:hypothetical protein